MKRKAELLREIGLMLPGCLLYALAFDLFLDPLQINPGGFSGLAMVAVHFTALPLGRVILLLNLPLVALGMWKLGGKFIGYTFLAVLFSSELIDLLHPLPALTEDKLLGALFGGLLLGAGMGLIFRAGASTGGSDILSKLINRYRPHIKLGALLGITDLFVIALSALTLGDPGGALYAVVAIYVNSAVVNALLYKVDKSVLHYIVSERWRELGDAIQLRLGRGITYIDAWGGYRRDPKQLILCAVRKSEVVPLYQLVLEIDPEAFVISSDSQQIYGNGFKRYHGQE